MLEKRSKQRETRRSSGLNGLGKASLASRSIAAIIPAYNEERFIGSVIHQAHWYADLVLVIDDGSTDSTARIAEDAEAVLIQHAANQGKCAAITTGFLALKKIIKKNKQIKVVVMVDADGQHCCTEIPRLARPILSGEADIVVGSRFLEVKSRIPKWRIFGQHALTLATNLGSGSKLTDSQSGFRAFSLKALDKMEFGSEGFSIESEMQFLAREEHLNIVEVPISVIYREHSKRNPFAQALHVINGIFKMIGQYRPLLFFGVSGALFLLMGIGWGIVVVDRYILTEQLAIGYGMICVLLSVVGMILISTGFTLHTVRGLLIELLRTRIFGKQK